MKTNSFIFVFFWVLMLPFSMVAQWQVLNVSGLPNSANSQLIFSPVDADIVWGIQSSDGGVVNPKFILTTNSGSTWTVSNVQLPSTHVVRSIHAINATIAYIAVDDPTGSNSGIYKTTNSGTSWVKHASAFSGTGRHPVQIYFFDDNNGLCVGNPSLGYWEIYTTTDGGGNWTRVSQANIPPNAVNDRTFTTTSAAAGNSYWFGTCARDLFRTTDKGLTWSVTQDAFFESADFCGVDIAFKDPMNGIAVTRMGVGEINRAYKTSNGGVTWSDLPTPPVVPSFKFLNHVLGDIYIATSHATTGYSVDPGSAFTADGGLTWHVIDNLIHGPAWSKDGWSWSGGINDIVYKIDDASVPVELVSFNSTAIGNNVELTWQTATETNNKGFEIYRNGNKIAFVEGNGTTTETQDYSFTDKNLQTGIYNYRLNQIDFDGTQKVVGELTVNLSLPEKFALEQNYPNPFNPSTTMRYSIPVSEFVTLKVYDVLGEEVATLVNEEKPAGSYEVEFTSHSDEGQNLTSGIYFYTLQAGSFTQTKKLILIK